MWVASTHSRADLIKLEKQGWVFLWILHGPQSPRPHGDRTPVRPHKVRYKVRYISFGENLMKISPVDPEIIGVHGIVKNKKEK